MAQGLANVRNAIYTILLAQVGATAQVHRYFRTVLSEAQFTARLVKSSKVHAWMVKLATEAPYTTTGSDFRPGRDPANTEFARYRFTLHGYYGVSDANASEEAWDGIVEGVIAAFRASKQLGLGPQVIDSGPLQWTRAGHVMLPPGDKGVLCHYAELDLGVKEQTE